MSITWLLPAAFGGLLLAAVPIAIHLLVRQQSRRLEFPSLRFLRPSRLAAWRRRSIQDAALLVCRILIIGAAVAAVASPVLRFSQRNRAYGSRLVRAIVAAPGEVPAAASQLTNGPIRSSVFARSTLADSMAEALAWLDDQPSAAREIAVAAAFRRGQVSYADLANVPPTTGIMLARLSAPAISRDLEFPVLVRRGGNLVRVVRHVRLEDASTIVTEGPASPMAETPIRVVASAKNRVLADAALRAVLAAGVPWPTGTAPIQVSFPDDGVPGESAATTLARAIDRAVASPLGTEPVLISDEALARWSRPPGPPPPSARPADEGDRRWLWAAALMLIVIESLLRRTSSGESENVTTAKEARVA
jgi:Aerotolerance regulator N-terminal